MFAETATQPLAATQPLTAPLRTRTRGAHVGSYTYLCRTGVSPSYDFTYSHVRFGKVVWHHHD